MLLLFPWLTVLAIAVALLMDTRWGEVSRGHPLVLFGRWVSWLEAIFHQSSCDDESRLRGRGILALFLAILVPLSAAIVLQLCVWQSAWLHWLMASVIIYFCIARRSLSEHAMAVAAPLQLGDLPAAREQLARIVSRDTQELSESEVASAVCESVLENGSDAIFAALFWYLVAGIPGVVLYRAANTLDAMWGYKNTRYRYFGWAAARLDDVLNWIPARLVALSYALVGNFSSAMQCWSQQASQWKSPNAGPVMAAGAGSLQIQLGGSAPYHGQLEARPVLGCGPIAKVDDIGRVLALVNRSLGLWVLALLLIALLLTL